MAGYFSSRTSFRSRPANEDIDPMTSMSGIGDVMLVFAVGLMAALVVAWSVDLGQFSEVELGEEIQDVEEIEENLESGGAGYIPKGVVYQDPTTGRYYLVQEDTDSASAIDETYEDESFFDETAEEGTFYEDEVIDSGSEGEVSSSSGV